MENRGNRMKSVDETWELLEQHCHPLPSERLGLEAALGRILHEDAVADSDQPPFSRSAMVMPSKSPRRDGIERKNQI